MTYVKFSEKTCLTINWIYEKNLYKNNRGHIDLQAFPGIVDREGVTIEKQSFSFEYIWKNILRATVLPPPPSSMCRMGPQRGIKV